MGKKSVIKFHVIFWIIISLVTVFNSLVYIEKTLNAPLFIGAFIRVIFNIATFYLFYFLVSPGLLSKKGIIILALLELMYLPLSGYAVTMIYYYPFLYYYNVPEPSKYILSEGIKEYFFYVVSSHTIFSILGALSKVSLIWYRNKMKQKEIEKQNVSIELALLRSQINPHFLFNTLNNIKSLIQKLPAKAVTSVEKLTDIMYYMLYESSEEKVPLKYEIKHINNYLELEKIRYSDPNYIEFNVSGENLDALIPPFILMPFVENAFKHGDKMKPAPGVKINLEANKSGIDFEINNYVKEGTDINKKNGGFGLNNIRRRLDLLFDKKYRLEINSEKKIFSVKLNLTYI